MTNHIIFVEFTPKGRRYTYLADDATIAAGDHVIVPVGPDNEEKLATVVHTEEIASEADFPFPLEKMKKVFRKLSEDFIEEAARSVPDSISGSIEEALRSKITDWTDWEKNECIAPPEEYDTYRELVLRGAEKDWPEALEALAYASYGGNNVFPTNWKKSEECLLKLIEVQPEPLPHYYNSLGYIYYYGRTTAGEPEYEKAYQYFSIGAILGAYESRYKLADMLLAGKGVPKNVEAAAILIKSLYKENRDLLEEGKPECKFADVALRLGGLHERGDGVEKNLKDAYTLYLQASFAIKERMKAGDFLGDKSVAEHIEEALQRVREALPGDFFRESCEGPGPFLIGALLEDSEGLDMAAIEKDGNWYLLARRADADEDGKVKKHLLTLPEMNICTLTDTIVMRIEDPEEVRTFSQTANVYINHIAFSKEDGHWVFWYMDHPMIVVKARAFSFEL